MVVYADTSFLFSLYAQDANTSSMPPNTPERVHRRADRHTTCSALNSATPCGFPSSAATWPQTTSRRLYSNLIDADAKTGALAETTVAWARGLWPRPKP
jgi:hypothetical protein